MFGNSDIWFGSVFLNQDRTGGRTGFNYEPNTKPGWVNTEIQSKLNQLKTHIEPLKTREPVTQQLD